MALPSSLERRLRRIPRSDLSWAFAWIGVVLLLEVYGRTGGAGAEVGNVLVLYALIVSTLLRHAVRPLGALKRMTASVRRLVQRLRPWRVRFGVDLRSTPPIDRAVPRLPACVAFAGIVLLATALAGREHLPEGLRSVALVSHALDAVLMALLWGLLAAASFVLLFAPIAFADALRTRDRREGDRMRRLMLWSTGELLFVTLGCSLTTPEVPMAIVIGVVGLLGATMLVPWMPRLAILFREERPILRLASIEWNALTALLHVCGASLALFLVVLSVGGGDTGQGANGVTTFLGEVFAWSLASVYLLQLYENGKLIWIGLRHDPARPRPVRLRVVGPCTDDQLREARACMTTGDLFIERSTPHDSPTDVQIRLDTSPDDEGGGRAWPRSLETRDLGEPDTVFALKRRGEVLRRRRLYRGLRRLFKEASRQDFSRGSGFWVGPHRWFLTHLTRDVDEDIGWTIGPAYRHLLPIESRSHFYEVMQGLELDLIFVEDGVGYRRFQRVLSALFEFHDVFGGRRRFDERHTHGLPGVRTLIHEFQMGASHWTSPYPEPDFDDLGRARILHVFRDRGEDFERQERPYDLDWIPNAPSDLVPAPSEPVGSI